MSAVERSSSKCDGHDEHVLGAGYRGLVAVKGRSGYARYPSRPGDARHQVLSAQTV